MAIDPKTDCRNDRIRRGHGPWRVLRWGAILAILLAPALAMRFGDQVNWGPGDFVVAFLLLAGGNLLYEALAMNRRASHRRLIAALIGLGVLVLWAQGAVGIL